SAQAAYMDWGNRSRRFTAQSPISSEVDGANILATVKPKRDWVIIGGHQNFLQPQSESNAPFLRAGVNTVQSNYDFKNSQFGGGVFQASVLNNHTLSEAVWSSRKITNRIDAGFNYFHSHSGSSRPSTPEAGTIHEVISPRLSLLHVLNHSGRQANVVF